MQGPTAPPGPQLLVQGRGPCQRVFLRQRDERIQDRCELFCALEIGGREFGHAHLASAQQCGGLRDGLRPGAVAVVRLRLRDQSG